ncbi:unnamed protein product [Orchesella dallaii]|uniref:Phosphoenolpyruvate synthase n=1 Tax=Orchesella dallaii TaxID=48710 RepID=A0ABP1QR23_9HEXA
MLDLIIFSAVLAAIILTILTTRKNEIHRLLKPWISKLLVKKWMDSQQQKFGKKAARHPKTFTETGLLCDKQTLLTERPIALVNTMISDELLIYGTDESENGICVQMIRNVNNTTNANVLLTLQQNVYHASFEGDTPNAYEFSLGNLKLELVEPLRAWRVWYNGLMKHRSNSSSDSQEKLVHVVLNFLWKPLSNPFDNRKDGNADLLAKQLFGKNSLVGKDITNLSEIVPEGYAQFGTLHGYTIIHEVKTEMYLYGFRTREMNSFEDLRKLCNADEFSASLKTNEIDGVDIKAKRFEFFSICDNGVGVRLTAFNGEWTAGWILWPSYKITEIKNINIPAAEFFKDLASSLQKPMNLQDRNGELISIQINPTSIKTSSDYKSTEVTFLRNKINGTPANAVLIFKSPILQTHGTNVYNLSESHCSMNVQHKYQPSFKKVDGSINYPRSKNENCYFVQFCEPLCLNLPLVGGKGVLLAKLETCGHTQKFKTARGFCVSTTLFNELLDVERFCSIFKSVSCNSNSDEQGLEVVCIEIMEIIKSGDAARKISPLIDSYIESMLEKEKMYNITFAVRSSGVLEDGTELSCAGQNQSFLGVSKELVPLKVVECWASLFTFQSVRYRLNHGQPVVSEMGVVIQEMVDAAAAGVIFTADPLTGNPFQMLITANYGLGESIVSGSCDPDTITLTRHQNLATRQNEENVNIPNQLSSPLTRPWWNAVTVEKRVLGEKRTKTVFRQKENKDEGSIMKITTNDEESANFCVSEETAVRLGTVAAEIEMYMGQHKPVDIEWAVDQLGQIVILQCRKVTGLDAWTDFEIQHELDSPIRNKMDRFTTANSGEVLPKAIHTLSEIIARILDHNVSSQVCKKKGRGFAPVSLYFANSCMLSHQRLILNMFHLLYSTVDKQISTPLLCVEQSVLGRLVIDEETLQIAIDRYGVTTAASGLMEFASQIKIFMTYKSIVENTSNTYNKFTLDYSNVPKMAKDVYDKISEDLIHIYHAANTHLTCTNVSTSSQLFLFLFLSEGKKPTEWDNSIYEDVSKLLSAVNNVESAQLPENMNQLVDEILRNGENFELFLQSSIDKALEWIQGNEKVSKALDIFFEKHGHRGFAEMDLGESSWQMNPASFIPTLRNIIKNKMTRNEQEKIQPTVKTVFKNDVELLDSLVMKPNSITRRLVKWILPLCRNGIICREKSKSLLVRTIGQLKLKYSYLAELMVKEMLLPNSSLIVHLTHFEIGQLVNRDVSTSHILQKAMKRQKMYPLLETVKLPELSVGMPVPEEIDTWVPIDDKENVQATPVSLGVARGIAKVCLNVEEAAEIIQPGDILITHATDIAWSPFFPLLGGVVTELGGLISHGAVVAREYGLPCVVGAVNATKIFKTGDEVILDASKGILAKICDK